MNRNITLITLAGAFALQLGTAHATEYRLRAILRGHTNVGEKTPTPVSEPDARGGHYKVNQTYPGARLVASEYRWAFDRDITTIRTGDRIGIQTLSASKSPRDWPRLAFITAGGTKGRGGYDTLVRQFNPTLRDGDNWDPDDVEGSLTRYDNGTEQKYTGDGAIHVSPNAQAQFIAIFVHFGISVVDGGVNQRVDYGVLYVYEKVTGTANPPSGAGYATLSLRSVKRNGNSAVINSTLLAENLAGKYVWFGYETRVGGRRKFVGRFIQASSNKVVYVYITTRLDFRSLGINTSRGDLLHYRPVTYVWSGREWVASRAGAWRSLKV